MTSPFPFDVTVDESTNGLVFDSFAEYVMETIYRPNVIRSFIREVSWEERLAKAIEQRSIRNRLRELGRKWITRLSMATDVLRGEHRCAEDDW